MPRFFFDTYDGVNLLSDDIGQELESIAAAKAEARRALPDMGRDPFPDGDRRTFIISVRNAAGKVILRLALLLMIDDEFSQAGAVTL